MVVGTACDPGDSRTCVAGHCPRAGRAEVLGMAMERGSQEPLSEVCLCIVAELPGKAESSAWDAARQKKSSHCVNCCVSEMQN